MCVALHAIWAMKSIAPRRMSAAIDAPILYAVWFNVPQDRAGEFNDWYESEHIPLLMKAPDWRMVRRFVITDGEPGTWTHLALHYLTSRDALQSPERDAARKTAWRDKLAAESCVQGNYTVLKGTATVISGSAPQSEIMDLKVSPVSVQQQAARKLRAAILAGVFQPGQRLVGSDLCERLGSAGLRSGKPCGASKLKSLSPSFRTAARLSLSSHGNRPRKFIRVRVLLEGEAVAACCSARNGGKRKTDAGCADRLHKGGQSRRCGRAGQYDLALLRRNIEWLRQQRHQGYSQRAAGANNLSTFTLDVRTRARKAQRPGDEGNTTSDPKT